MTSDDEEWTYSIDEVGEDATDDGQSDREGENEDGSSEREIEPGMPTPENVLFVALGVLIAVGTIVHGLGIL